jgi:hypothetical protein
MNLTPKSIIFDTLNKKLSGSGITKIVLIFKIDSEQYNVMLTNTTGENMKVELEKSEISMIKKVFVSRIIKAWNKKHPSIPAETLIVEIELLTEEIKIFISDPKKEVYKFEY